jgi:D-glycerate 3-kinase
MKVKPSFLELKKRYLKFISSQEVSSEPFYDKIGQLKKFYLPISELIFKKFNNKKKTIIIGLSGGQGSGKSTIARILKLILKQKYNLNTINISIDDYYKTSKERKKMSLKVNKLFLTRGVPGTHDVKLLSKHLKALKKLSFNSLKIPKFDKSLDDRLPKKKWSHIKKKQDIVIFEGWCIGAKAENKNKLKKPINILERNEDANLTWRKKVNYELNNSYGKIFRLIDSLIFLKVPSFQYVYKWRLLQEKKIKLRSKSKKIMNNLEIKKFIMFYERTTKNMIKNLSKKANILIALDKKHKLKSMRIN